MNLVEIGRDQYAWQESLVEESATDNMIVEEKMAEDRTMENFAE